jgi:biotin carboxyl carrier protein
MEVFIQLGGEEIAVRQVADSWEVNGVAVQPDIIQTDAHSWHVVLNDRSFRIIVDEHDANGRSVSMQVNGKPVQAERIRPLDKLLKSMGMDAAKSKKANDMKAPMPGLIRDVKVQVGMELKAGDPVLVLEAMKMENILKAPSDAVIKSIHVETGDKVEKNTVLVTFE